VPPNLWFISDCEFRIGNWGIGQRYVFGLGKKLSGTALEMLMAVGLVARHVEVNDPAETHNMVRFRTLGITF
jgi:hypothetical protein